MMVISYNDGYYNDGYMIPRFFHWNPLPDPSERVDLWRLLIRIGLERRKVLHDIALLGRKSWGIVGQKSQQQQSQQQQSQPQP